MSIIDEMNAKFSRVAGVRFCSSAELYPEIAESRPVLVVDNGLGRLVLALHGAHVMSFTPKGGRDILWLSPQTGLAEGKPIRGGIPLCMPWFGPHPDGLPLHGFARLMLWQVDDITSQADGSTSVALSLRDTKETRDVWPHEFLFRFEIGVGNALSLDMMATNESKSRAEFAFAFHTYFDVADISKTTVEGLENATYLDRLDGDAEKSHAGALVFKGETQRLYSDVAAVQRIKSPLGVWKIEGNAHCALAWNPGENDKNVADIGAGKHVEFICLERLDAVHWSVPLNPGATYTTKMILSAE